MRRAQRGVRSDARVAERVQHHGDCLEGVRCPDRVDVHGEPAAGVTGVAVAPACRLPLHGIARRKGDEIRREADCRRTPLSFATPAPARAASGARVALRRWSRAGTRACARAQRRRRRASAPRARGAGTRRRSYDSSHALAGAREARFAPARAANPRRADLRRRVSDASTRSAYSLAASRSA